MTKALMRGAGVYLQDSYPHDAGVVGAGSGRVIQIAAVDGALQRLGGAAVVASGTEDPLRRQTSGLTTKNNQHLGLHLRLKGYS